MALPRPLIFALLGLVLVGAALFATQVMAGGSSPEATQPSTPDTEQAQTPPASRPSGGPGAGKPGAPAKQPNGVSGRAVGAMRALDSGKILVVLFVQDDAADDDATAHAARALRSGGSRAVVVVDSLENVADYGPIAANLGISQAPSVVIADGERKARVLEGYQDEGTLRQTVRDATR